MTRTGGRPLLASAVAVALLGGLLAGCASKSAANREPYTGSTTAVVENGVQQVTLTVDNSFRFTPSTITVHSGQVKLTLQHKDIGAPHNWQLVGIPGAYAATVDAGQSSSVTFAAPAPGKYTFECTIHVKQGQTGTLIVAAD